MTKYGVYILSHGRSERVYTYKTLREAGYTGPITIVCDDLDSELDEYKARFEDVVTFSKSAYAGTFDIGDNGGNDSVVVYARNAVWDIAAARGDKYFLVLDDDYTSFNYRYPSGESLKATKAKDIEPLFELYFEFLETTGAVAVCFAQAGDFIGGYTNTFRKGILRKAMNVWFLSTERRFQFFGRINEDTSTYLVEGAKGKLFLTPTCVSIVQKETQSNKGGLTDIYLQVGTYTKSFYSVMMAPSCTKVYPLNTEHSRLHHRVNWEHAVPKIVSQSWKKES